MNLVVLMRLLTVLWPVSEIALGVRSRLRRGASVVEDRGSVGLIWGAVAVGIFSGVAIRAVSATRIPMPGTWLASITIPVLLAGLAVRWTAILTLGRFFDTSVAIRQDHRIIATGLYRRVRHPSYTGLLLTFVGLGLSFGNWLSVIVILVPVSLAILNRIRIEESLLTRTFGQEYLDYCKSVKRLIPGVY